MKKPPLPPDTEGPLGNTKTPVKKIVKKIEENEAEKPVKNPAKDKNTSKPKMSAAKAKGAGRSTLTRTQGKKAVQKQREKLEDGGRCSGRRVELGRGKNNLRRE